MLKQYLPSESGICLFYSGGCRQLPEARTDSIFRLSLGSVFLNVVAVCQLPEARTDSIFRLSLGSVFLNVVAVCQLPEARTDSI
jgi:hypothetical protein